MSQSESSKSQYKQGMKDKGTAVVNTTDKNIEDLFMNEMNDNHKQFIGAPSGGPDQAMIYERLLQELEAEVRGHIRF